MTIPVEHGALAFLTTEDLPISFDERELNSRADFTFLEAATRGKWRERDASAPEWEFDFLEFDWVHGPEDRNWWWQVQGLPFLHWMVAAYLHIPEGEREAYHGFARGALFRWIRCAMDCTDSPLAWHDHAAAYRLRNLTRWLNFLAARGILGSVLDPNAQSLILEVVIRHVGFLTEEANYSKHTNHGLDQALAVYTLYLSWGRPTVLEDAGQLARDRLLGEIAFAFTNEGVHVENSPSYQKSMLGRLQALSELAVLGDTEIHRVAASVVEGAKRFLSIITLPDGRFPMIGDTRGEDRWQAYELDEGLELFDYSSSGYYVARGRCEEGVPFHLVFKCGHRSNYHRHDDDLSLHWVVGDEVVLGDGGLGSYQEQDPRRCFLRSALAHNVPFVEGVPAGRDASKLPRRPAMGVRGAGVVTGRSWTYGGCISRTVDLRGLRARRVRITDTFEGFPGVARGRINYFLPGSPECRLIGNNAALRTERGTVVRIALNTRGAFYRFNGWDEVANEGAVHSRAFGTFTDATSLGWSIAVAGTRTIETRVAVEIRGRRALEGSPRDAG